MVLPPHRPRRLYGRMFAIDSVGSPFRMRPTRLGLGSLPLDVDVEVMVVVIAVVALMFGAISQQSSLGGMYVEVAPVLVVVEDEEAASFQPTDVIPSNPMFVPKVASTGYSGPFTRAM